MDEVEKEEIVLAKTTLLCVCCFLKQAVLISEFVEPTLPCG